MNKKIEKFLDEFNKGKYEERYHMVKESTISFLSLVKKILF